MPTTPQYSPMVSNPFRDAYDAIWTMLEANGDFMGFFPNSGQRVKLNADWIFKPNPDLTDASPADYPRIRLAYTKFNANLENDSCGSQPIWTIEIQIWTGVQQQRLLMECLWPIARAMTNWRQYVRDVVTWNSECCVTDVDPQEVEIAIPDVEDESKRTETRGTEQWICAWKGEIRFNFSTADMMQI
jgi:hypothetical protein